MSNVTQPSVESNQAKFSFSKLRRSPLTILLHLSVAIIVVMWTLPQRGYLSHHSEIRTNWRFQAGGLH